MQHRYILFQAYGSEGILQECKIALMQLLKYNNAGSFSVVLYTDNQDFFKPILQQFKYHEIIQLSSEKQKQWRGAIDFVFRIKIEMIIHFFETHSGAMLYFDTDTYCKTSITPIFDEIENGSILMHTYEGNLDNTRNITFKKWRRFLKENIVSYDNKPITKTDKIQMWNAGVLGFSDRYVPELKDVLKLTDEIYPWFPNHTVEQFAFSFIFQNTTTIKPADQIIYHYWNLKEYKALLEYFFEKNHALSLLQQNDKLQYILPEFIFTEKTLYKNLPFFKKWGKQKWDINTYKRLVDAH